jgi:hypothetical protein
MTDAIRERFASDTAEHVMTVLHDDGLYRHLRFRAPKSGMYWFDLITVPGALIFQGDGESFVFSRITDMFEFFRGPVGRINPGYWAEKLTSGGREAVMRYDEDLFVARVSEAFADAARDGGVPAGAGRALREAVLSDDVIYHEDTARAALDGFEYGEFRFYDTWEWSFRDYHWWFLWSLHAIVWGIGQYDASHGRPVVVAPVLAAPARPAAEASTVQEAAATAPARAAGRVVTLQTAGERL